MEVLREIIAKFIVTARPVERDGKWTVLFEPVVPENRALQLMLTADSESNGNLLQRLLKVGKPTGLSARDERPFGSGWPEESMRATWPVNITAIPPRWHSWRAVLRPGFETPG